MNALHFIAYPMATQRKWLAVVVLYLMRRL